MVRLLVLYNTPEDKADFDKHYSEIHIPLARQLPGLLAYTVSRDLATLGGRKDIYLVAELDFPDAAALHAALSSEIGQQAAADVPTFASGGATMLTFEVADA